MQALGDAKPKLIAAGLISTIRKTTTIDWSLRESARAKIKVKVKRILNKHGCPPDLQEEAVKTVREALARGTQAARARKPAQTGTRSTARKKRPPVARRTRR